MLPPFVGQGSGQTANGFFGGVVGQAIGAIENALLDVKAKALAVGKIVAETTAMRPVQPLVALPVTNLVVAPSSLVPATSNPTPQRAKALRANVAAPAC